MKYGGLLRFVAGGAVCIMPAYTHAQSVGLDQIRQQIQELRADYEARINALEERLKAAEAEAQSTKQAASLAIESAQKAQSTAAQAETSAVAATQRPSAENALNPAISLILNGSWGYVNHDPTAQITGFQDSRAAEILGRGPSLGESELFAAANIDPYFRGALLAALTPKNELDVEEAYFETLSLGSGFTLKGGRFFSGVGYWNAQHPHSWDFTDASLVQRAFLGNNYGDDGVQLRWVAPLPFFLQLGAEAGRGREFAGMAATQRNGNGANSWAFFAKLGDDIGASYSWQFGLSHLRQDTGGGGVPLFDYDDVSHLQNVFVGRQRITGADLVVKWAPEGNSVYENIRFTTEFYRRELDGELTYDAGGQNQSGAAMASQSGWFLQGIYQFHPYWRAGLRYDRLFSGTVNLGSNAGNLTVPEFDPSRWTFMTDFNPSEFSRIRLQVSQSYTHRDSATGKTIPDTIGFLQYIFSVGAHGAHQF